MKKIKTIFDRDWKGDKTVTDKYAEGVDPEILKNYIATEKLDGMNVRVTVRNHTVVRLEKRRNPDKIQKAKGIVEPWYVDADSCNPQDKYLCEAVINTDFSDIPDGEWSAEALGKNIQGNPLGLDKNVLCIFDLGMAPVLQNAPITYNELKEWLPFQKTKFGNPEFPVEGIVWRAGNMEKHDRGYPMFKIKTKDFFKDNRK